MKEREDFLALGGESFRSRLFIGTGKFSSGDVLRSTVQSSGSEMVTVAMKRANPKDENDSILSFLDTDKVRLLPNTSGVRDAKEAVFVARMAREALSTNWLKLEIHPDPKYLMPDPVETLEATRHWPPRGSLFCLTVMPTPFFARSLRRQELPRSCLWISDRE